MDRKGFSAIVIILIVVIILAAAGGIWYYNYNVRGSNAGKVVTGALPIPQNISPPSSIVPIAVPPQFQNKVAFLKNGEVLLANDDGSDQAQFTHTNGTVADFSFSPGIKYLAYDRTVPSSTEVDIVDTDSGDIVWTINKSPELNFPGSPEFYTWYSDDRFSILVDQYLEANGPYIFDVQGTSTPLYYPEESAWNPDVTNGYDIPTATNTSASANSYRIIEWHAASLLYAKDDSNSSSTDVELRSLDTATREDNLVTMLGAFSPNSTPNGAAGYDGSDISLGYDGTSLAIAEGNDAALQSAIDAQSEYDLRTYGEYHPSASLPFMETESMVIYPSTTLYTTSATSSADEYQIGDPRWSRDDRYLGFVKFPADFDLADNGPAPHQVIIVNVSDPAYTGEFTVDPGYDFNYEGFQWTHNDTVIFESSGSIYLYDPRDNTSTLFAASSTSPLVFGSVAKADFGR